MGPASLGKVSKKNERRNACAWLGGERMLKMDFFFRKVYVTGAPGKRNATSRSRFPVLLKIPLLGHYPSS